MTPEELKQQVIRLEGFGDGIKAGAQLFAQWLAEKLAQDEKKKEDISENK